MPLLEGRVGWVIIATGLASIVWILWKMDTLLDAHDQQIPAIRAHLENLQERVDRTDYWLMALAHQLGLEFVAPDVDDSPQTEPIEIQKPTPGRRDEQPPTMPQDAVLLAHWSSEAAARAGARAMELEDRIREIRARTEQRNAQRPVEQEAKTSTNTAR